MLESFKKMEMRQLNKGSVSKKRKRFDKKSIQIRKILEERARDPNKNVNAERLHRKWIGIESPVQLMVKMMTDGVNLDKLKESIKGVRREDKRGPVLSEKWETNGFAYPIPKEPHKGLRSKLSGWPPPQLSHFPDQRFVLV